MHTEILLTALNKALGFIAKNIKLSLFDRFTRVYKSETKAKTPNPEWSAFTRSCVELCNGQKDRKMKITVFDDRKGKWVQMLANPAQLGNFKILPHIIYSTPHPTSNRLTKCCNNSLVRQYICATSALHLYVGTRPVLWAYTYTHNAGLQCYARMTSRHSRDYIHYSDKELGSTDVFTIEQLLDKSRPFIEVGKWPYMYTHDIYFLRFVMLCVLPIA